MSIKNLLPGKIGLGGAPLGNMFRAIPEEEAHATVSEAWNLGVRYFDTAPLYGSGLSEIRMGEALSQYPRDEYVLSSKVGRIMLDEMEDPAKRDFGEKGGLFEHGLKNKILNDYSADATLRSIEDSLKRLMPEALEQNVDIVVGGPYSSGVLAGGEHFEYQKASAAIQQKVAQINTIATRFNVNVKAAALQFALANPAVAAVIPGSSRPGRMAEDLAALNAPVPAEFWAEMRRQNLVAENAPLPTR